MLPLCPTHHNSLPFQRSRTLTLWLTCAMRRVLLAGVHWLIVLHRQLLWLPLVLCPRTQLLWNLRMTCIVSRKFFLLLSTLWHTPSCLTRARNPCVLPLITFITWMLEFRLVVVTSQPDASCSRPLNWLIVFVLQQTSFNILNSIQVYVQCVSKP